MAENEKMQDVPEGWEVKTLLQGVGGRNDHIVAGPFGSSLKVSDYVESGVPILRLQNIDRYRFIDKDIKFISHKKAKELEYHSFVGGDVVLAKLGDPVGKTCIVPDYFNHGIVVSDVVRIRVEEVIADRRFVVYILNSKHCNDQLYRDLIGTTRPRVNLTQIRNLMFFFPSKPEQSKIASILSTCDEAIEKTDAKIEKLKHVKKGLMQDLFHYGIDENGKMRNEAIHRFKDSPLGRIPEEWEVKRIVECAKVKGGKRLPNGHTLADFQTQYPYIRVIDFRNNSVFQKNLEYLTKDTQRLIARYVISKNDIYISIAGTIGLVGIIPNILDGANLTENAAKITEINQNIDQCFLMYFLDSENVKHQIASLIGVTTQPKLALEKIEMIIVSLPKKEEQFRIASILSSADEAIEKEEAYKNKLLSIKCGLMDDLLSGKVRVNKLIKEAA